MSLSTRQVRALILVGMVVGAVGVPVLAAVFSNPVPQSGTIPYQTNSGATINLDGDVNTSSGNPFPDNQTVELETSEGNATFRSPADVNATVNATDLTGTWTNVSSLNVTAGELKIDPEDKPAMNVSGDTDRLAFTSVGADDGSVDLVYAGASGTTNLTVRGLQNDTRYVLRDADSNDVLGGAQSDANGNLTVTGLPNSEHRVLVQSNSPPSFNNSTASPTGGQSTPPQELSINITDPDNPGDNVTVEFFVKEPGHTSFSSVGTDSRSSNGTVSVAYEPTDGGDYDWYAEATDEAGATATSDTFTFSNPSNLTIRNETNASQIVTGANVTITFYSADGTTIVQKSDDDDDGNISLDGLPITDFVAVIESDGYYTRRAYIRSLFDQQNIYLLNSTAYPNAINTNFVYEDRTGNFPSADTILQIQRGVDPDEDGNFTWETIAGDFWGAAGEFPFTGQTNARYRVVIENTDTNTRRIQGTHIPTSDGTKNIVVGQLEWPALNESGRVFDALLDDQTITIVYHDPVEESTDVRIRVWERGNQSNTIYDQTFTGGPYGTLQVPVSLTEEQAEQSWVVNYTASHDSDGELAGQMPVGANPFGLSIDPWLLGTLSWIFLTFGACLYGPRTAVLGAWTIVLIAGGLMIFQWVAVPLGSFIAAVLIAAGGTWYREAVP